MTDAERRSKEVKLNRGPRPERKVAEPAPWERESWIDEGPMRDAAKGAAARGQVEPENVRKRRPSELDAEVVAEVQREAGAARAGRAQERLVSASEALGRGRFDDARRMVQPVLRELPNIALAHEIAGLSFYGVGQWRKAAAELELARTLEQSVRLHAVLADCYRAMRRYETVMSLWAELKSASPSHELMAEGRIVAASALADQGDLRGALTLLDRARSVPNTIRDYHVRQWYVLADIYDRSGDIVEARRFFALVARTQPDFADVGLRLSALGR